MAFVKWTPWNKFGWNLNLNSIIFIKENSYENVVCLNGGHFVQTKLYLQQDSTKYGHLKSIKSSDVFAWKCPWYWHRLGSSDEYLHQWTGSSSLINTLWPRQNGRHFPDDIFKWNFLNEHAWILIKITLKFVPGGPINNIPVLFQVMAWWQIGQAIMWTNADPIHWHIYVALGGDELRWWLVAC